jgi:predicted O-methyltransferase YrrM
MRHTPFRVRLAQRLWDATHRSRPWIAPAAVRFLDQALPGTGVGLEWGSGRSTRWFARHLGHLTSIEDDAGWYRKVKGDIEDLDNVDLHLLDHTAGPTSSYVRAVDRFPDGALDFVMIDGQERHACLAAAMPKVRAGTGLLVADDTAWPEWRADLDDRLATWDVVHDSAALLKSTTIWRRPG